MGGIPPCRRTSVNEKSSDGGLAPGTTYDVQLVATNYKGTSYGGNITFTTTGSGGGGGGGASCGTVAPGDKMSASIAE